MKKTNQIFLFENIYPTYNFSILNCTNSFALITAAFYIHLTILMGVFKNISGCLNV